MGKAGGGKILMLLGVVLSIGAGLIVFFVTQTATAAPTEVPRKNVVVARTDIVERTLITPDLLRVAAMPEDIIPPGAVFKLEDVVNKFAKEKIHNGNAVLTTHLATTGKPGETPPAAQPIPPAPANPPPVKKVDAAFALEKGKTIVAVDYPEAAKLIATGILKPGNKVDIYVKTAGATSEQIALIYSNIEIKAIGNLSQTEDAPPSPTMIFEVTPQDALVLKYLETMSPILLLRAAGDETVIRTDLVTMEYIIARFQLQRPAAAR